MEKPQKQQTPKAPKKRVPKTRIPGGIGGIQESPKVENPEGYKIRNPKIEIPKVTKSGNPKTPKKGDPGGG